MAVNADLEAPPIVNYGQPAPESAVTARSLIPQTNTPGTLPIPNGALGNGMTGNMPNALSVMGLNEGDLVKQYQATQAGRDMMALDASKRQRLAAYKAANPNASEFQASFYSQSPEEQAAFRAMYPGEAGGKAQNTSFTGAAPEAGQSMFDYMLANNGAMPETKMNEGPTLQRALLNAALLASAGFGVGTLGNALMAGAGAAGAGTAGLTGSSGLNTLLGGAAADTVGATAASTASNFLLPELVITAGAGGMSPAVAAALGLGGMAAAGTLLSGSPGSTTTPGSQGSGTPDNYQLPEETLVPTTPNTPPLIPPFTLDPFAPVTPAAPTINSNQPGLKPMPNFPLDPPPTPDVPDVSQPDQPGKDPTSDTKTTTTMTTVLPPTVPGSTGVSRTIPTLKSFTPTGSSEAFNLNQFLTSMTTPRATANLGNVSPFSGGGVGPGAGPLNLKGSSAPDIYPWVQDAEG
jgi:hypothetical protein